MNNVSFPFRIPFGGFAYKNHQQVKDIANKYFYSQNFTNNLNQIGKEKNDYSIGPHEQDHKRSLYESSSVLFDAELPSKEDNLLWTDFRNFVVDSVSLFSNQINNNFVNYNQEAVVLDSWFHITNSNGYHAPHDHRNYPWGCIYYVQTSECSTQTSNTISNGVNNFYSPFEGLIRDIPGLEWCTHTGIFSSTPKEGNLIIFPGFLKHDATPYKGNEDRIVIAANIGIIDSNSK